MKRIAVVFVLALAAAACFDAEPSGIVPDKSSELDEYSVGRPGPRIDLRALRSPSFSLASCCSCGCDLGVLGTLPYTGAVTSGRDFFVVGTGSFPAPNAFISFFDLSLHEFLFEGYASQYNGLVVAGAEVTLFNTPPGGFPPGQGMPILLDMVSAIFVDLPLPPNGVSGIPTGLGGGRRPPVAGTVTLDGGQTVAVLWTWDSIERDYVAQVLPTTNPAANSAALAMSDRAQLIVGSADGHPAMWSLPTPALFAEHAAVNGEFRGLNSTGTLVGMETGVGGFVVHSADPIANRVAIPAEPFAINIYGHVAGVDALARPVIVLQNGLVKPLPFPDGTSDAIPTFVDTYGLVGGVAGSKPVTWAYNSFDSDHDGAPDGLDNCPLGSNALQEDADSDEIGDVCDTGLPPSVTLTANTLTRIEGGAFSFFADATDPLGRPLTYAWDFGDETTWAAKRAPKIYGDDGSYIVSVDVSNGFDIVTEDVMVTVTNARPDLVVTAAATATVGVPFDLQIDATDPGTADVLRYRVLWGDAPIEGGECGTSPCVVNLQHTYAAPGANALRVRIYDDEGAVRAFETTVTVN